MNAESERVIKKYPNRRLYDTATSTYITLTDIKEMILRHEPIRIIDAKTQEDLTRSVYLQILLEEEVGGQPIFSTEMLASIIRFYGQASQTLFGQYLENSLKTFLELQSRMQERFRAIYGENAVMAPEILAQFLSLQPKAMQSMLDAYLEQTQNLWQQVNQQMQRQALGWFEAFYPKPHPVDSKKTPNESQ
ncbi:polyhydroxyalkanoate synthesis repressor PhaR [Hydrogenophilus islandicus]